MTSPAADKLRSRYQLLITPLDLAGRRLELLRPESVDDLIDAADLDREDGMPYWAEMWSASLVLAERVLQEERRGQTCLELGCGVGLVALAAAAAGYDVTATDYDPAALEFTLASAWHNELANLQVERLDWRQIPEHLRQKFDLVVASEVLYEFEQAPTVAAALAELLAPGGRALIADPRRSSAAAFADQCRQRGLQVARAQHTKHPQAETTHTIEIYEVRR